MLQATHIEIDTDEGGFFLSVYAEGVRHDFRIEGAQERLYDQAKARIGPWLHERELARRTAPTPLYVDDSGYDLSDPKHESFHSVHADIWDARADR